MKLSNRTEGNTDVKICFMCTKEIKHKIFTVWYACGWTYKRGTEVEVIEWLGKRIFLKFPLLSGARNKQHQYVRKKQTKLCPLKGWS